MRFRQPGFVQARQRVRSVTADRPERKSGDNNPGPGLASVHARQPRSGGAGGARDRPSYERVGACVGRRPFRGQYRRARWSGLHRWRCGIGTRCPDPPLAGPRAKGLGCSLWAGIAATRRPLSIAWTGFKFSVSKIPGLPRRPVDGMPSFPIPYPGWPRRIMEARSIWLDGAVAPTGLTSRAAGMLPGFTPGAERPANLRVRRNAPRAA